MVSHDSVLAELLLREVPLTLVDDPRRLLRAQFLATIDVLALDCGRRTEEVLALVPSLKARHAGLDIVLIDGGLTQQQLAAAFAAGARDYFPDSYDAELLAERIRGLSQARGRRAAVAGGGGASA